MKRDRIIKVTKNDEVHYEAEVRWCFFFWFHVGDVHLSTGKWKTAKFDTQEAAEAYLRTYWAHHARPKREVV